MMASETVREALSRYHQDNGFRGDAMVTPTLQMRIFGRTVDLPNPEFQRPLIARHDLHHVLTGYRTDLRGEAEMGAWEIGAGPAHVFVWANNLAALMLAVFAPIRVARALAAGRRCRSLYRSELAYETMLEMRVPALRRELRRS